MDLAVDIELDHVDTFKHTIPAAVGYFPPVAREAVVGVDFGGHLDFGSGKSIRESADPLLDLVAPKELAVWFDQFTVVAQRVLE